MWWWGAASEGAVNEDISHAARQELPLPVVGRQEWEKRWRRAEKKASPLIKWVTAWMLNVLCRRWEGEKVCWYDWILLPGTHLGDNDSNWTPKTDVKMTQMTSELWWEYMVSRNQPCVSMNVWMVSGSRCSPGLHTPMPQWSCQTGHITRAIFQSRK